VKLEPSFDKSDGWDLIVPSLVTIVISSTLALVNGPMG